MPQVDRGPRGERTTRACGGASFERPGAAALLVVLLLDFPAGAVMVLDGSVEEFPLLRVV